MINSIQQVKSRIAEIESKIDKLNKSKNMQTDSFNSELQKTNKGSTEEIIQNLNIDGKDTDALNDLISRINPDDNVSSKKSLDFYKMMSNSLFK
ncbi:MAG: hypothetical protein ACQESP_04745 [Candidatus Muiribacteriota bacterium]